MAKYKPGTDDPKITSDVGAGSWNSKSKTLEMRLKKAAIIQALPHAYAIIGDDAVKHMAHYLGNSGTDYTIDLEDLLKDVKDEKKNFDDELIRARKFVETLPAGCYLITSDKATGGYVLKSENWNWFFATGGYSYWGKGVATIDVDSKGEKTYLLNFEYKFFDRYNWDSGKKVEIFGIEITDKFMGEFHRQGMAQEFNMYGSVKRDVKWTGKSFGNPTITKPGGRD